MSDEIFFREVNEEIRQDRTRALWSNYGKLIIALAVLAVILAGAFVFWREYQTSQANASSDRYSAAITLATAGQVDEALTALEALSNDGYGAYRDLARMRIASLRAGKGDPAAAVAAFDEIAADGAAPDAIRDMAAVRAAYILVDSGSIDDVRQRVERLSGDAEPLRFAVRETLGLAEWKAGNFTEAKRFFDQLNDDQGTPAGIGLRTRVMLDLIASGTSPASASSQAPAPETQAPAAAEPVAPTPVEPAPAPAPVDPPVVAPDASAPTPAAPTAADVPTQTAPAPATDPNTVQGAAPAPAPAPSAAPAN